MGSFFFFVGSAVDVFVLFLPILCTRSLYGVRSTCTSTEYGVWMTALSCLSGVKRSACMYTGTPGKSTCITVCLMELWDGTIAKSQDAKDV